MSSSQLHKRLSKQQVETILEQYIAKEIGIDNALANLGIKRARFFRLLDQYRNHSETFMTPSSATRARHVIDEKTETVILHELAEQKKLIENKAIPVWTYHYSMIRDTLIEQHMSASVPTIINRAKKYGYYIEEKLKKIHDREVITHCTGELIQHDSSIHQWSPFMEEKLYLITSLDDYSRMLLYADFVSRETAYTHIVALESVFLRYGFPLKYYPDQHSIFRYVHDRDKHNPWNTYTKFTDDVVTQWNAVLKECNVNVTYALSPQAKGKIERPYRWLQDRIVRIAAKEHITTIEGLRKVLYHLVETYNTKWVHSTTKEIPLIRFEKAINERQNLFRKFALPSPYQDLKDVFCLRDRRVVDAYRKISWEGIELRVPNGTPKETVDLKIIPDHEKRLVEVRFWQGNRFCGNLTIPMEQVKKVSF